MKRLSFSIILILLIIAASDVPQAKVTGQCSNCHTMHYSQGGGQLGQWGPSGPYNSLTVNDCLGCHSHENKSDWYELDNCKVPIVFTINTEPSTYLAGGNFYWVAQAGGDAKGHNVMGISGVDESLSVAPGKKQGCANSCHYSLANNDDNAGCEGCHLNPAHHADDSATVIGAASPSTDGYYRFLSGHMSGDNHGVCGIEDPDWQATKGAGDHNEYLGWSGELEWPAGFYNLRHSMTAFCCGCHENFHVEQDSSENWIRHPSDAVIPNEGEYQSAFSAGYDPLVPVARPSLPAADPSLVYIGTDMVMCLSCHRPHGSPYYKLMRWDYKNWPGSGTDGCGKCHTSKN